MGFWPVAALIIGVALVVGMAMPSKPAAKRDPESPPLPDDGDLWTADALARVGTPETIADLVAQGRADELRGLGYEGELPRDE